MALSGGYTNDWDETAPVGSTTQAASIDDIIRALKTDIRERICDLFGMSEAQFEADPMEPQSVPFNLLPLRRSVGPFRVAYGEMSSTDVTMPIGLTSNPTYITEWYVFRACKVKNVHFECSANVTTGTAKITLHGGATVGAVATLSAAGDKKSTTVELETPYALDADSSLTVSLEISGPMGAGFDTDGSVANDVTFHVWLEVEDDIPSE